MTLVSRTLTAAWLIPVYDLLKSLAIRPSGYVRCASQHVWFARRPEQPMSARQSPANTARLHRVGSRARTADGAAVSHHVCRGPNHVDGG